jgi:hypothetical protein
VEGGGALDAAELIPPDRQQVVDGGTEWLVERAGEPGVGVDGEHGDLVS